jgi:xanthine dehydrogenase accessory factor
MMHSPYMRSASISEPVLYSKLMSLFEHSLVLVKGAGDLGTGVVWRLHKAGFPVIITELAQPRVVRRTVAFASAVYEGEIAVEGVTAWRASSFDEAKALIDDDIIPVLVDPQTRSREFFEPIILIDAIMAKQNTGTHISDAPLVMALGPGFEPKVDCHAVIETKRGHNLGRVFWDRAAEPNTNTPGEIVGKSADRVLRAPRDGQVAGVKKIGEQVIAGELLATVDGSSVQAPFDGILRGLAHDGLGVRASAKIGDVDPRSNREYCFTISDKSLAVGGAALEAILSWMLMKTLAK